MERGCPVTRRSLLKGGLALALVQRPGMGLGADSTLRWWRQYLPVGDGLQVHVHCAAPVDPTASVHRPLVCFHPTAYSGAFFAEFATLMATDRWVISPDTPGFGNSDQPAQMPTMQDYARSMADALDGLGFGRLGTGSVDLLGFHTGCFVATELAALRPDLVGRLVLPGIPFEEGEERAKSLKENAKEKAYFTDAEEFARMWMQRYEWQGSAVTIPRLLELLGEELKSGPDHWWAYQAVFTYEAEKRLYHDKTPISAARVPEVLDVLNAPFARLDLDHDDRRRCNTLTARIGSTIDPPNSLGHHLLVHFRRHRKRVGYITRCGSKLPTEHATVEFLHAFFVRIRHFKLESSLGREQNNGPSLSF